MEKYSHSNIKKKKKKGKYNGSLPKEIIMFESCDKQSHEHWTPGRDLANFPKPFKMIITGPPNRGKTLIAHNIIIRCKPQFDEIFLVHIDSTSEEWGRLVEEENHLDCVPPLEFFNNDRDTKSLIILEDFQASKNDVNLNHLFRYTSTHCNVSVMLIFQAYFFIPPIYRRLTNIYIIYPMVDLNASAALGRRVGLDKEQMEKLFALCTSVYDFIVLDLTKGTPCKIRFNLFHPVKKEYSDDSRLM